ncbi:Ni/Fe-hydrogenase, b-type cytochrome subunit [Acidihalobacter yilgarnensis]|uniref:Ni/Fe-hydrogenase, b-type cytochrome subunit n=1 Tax=Acidihalobacter yilgarnensis TaxID=2819280 RepID=A0A1D8ILQ5_9GAMM|nr:Ni/Fe-hydrogenase, b-type cytochrome subunit [Acidihalobacter yilgarnensis]AOU97395.1 Ni/Fe-hydrogenase, b-type cytochrome subunit [Acidihalobacter yilgarnensis]
MSETASTKPVYVYEAPVRLWHWINAGAITVLAITGYLIGSPPPSLSGQASQHYLMGDIRFIHFTAAYIFTIGLLGRMYWAFVGNRYSRELFLPPVFSGEWWRGLFFELRWYLFLERKPHDFVGHNPLAQIAMFCMFVLGSLFMICTGFALYAEELGPHSWAESLFGWVVPLFGGNPQTVHTWHHLGMWFLICFVIAHVYIAVREDIVSRQTMVSTMINGWRVFKDRGSE